MQNNGLYSLKREKEMVNFELFDIKFISHSYSRNFPPTHIVEIIISTSTKSVAGFLPSSTTDILSWIIICCVHCRMLSSFPGLYLLDANSMTPSR